MAAMFCCIIPYKSKHAISQVLTQAVIKHDSQIAFSIIKCAAARIAAHSSATKHRVFLYVHPVENV